MVLYNLGRITTYALLAIIFSLFASALPEQAFPALRLVSAALLVLCALYLINASRILTRLEAVGVPLWRKLQPVAARLLPVQSVKSAYALGLLWGFIPCGLVYTALVFSLANPAILSSALMMICFGLGTLPAMLGTGIFAQQLRPLFDSPKAKAAIAMTLFIFAYLVAEPVISNLE